MSDKIEIGHGSGGLMTRKLIRELFIEYFGNKWLNLEGDSAVLNMAEKHLAYTTDAHVISPLFFPGGDLGKLAICGTVNDLAVAGAVPLYLTASFIIEEGLEYDILEKIVRSMRDEASLAGVNIVAGDTKVVEHGKADGLYISTSGIGIVQEQNTSLASMKAVAPGDTVFVSGTIGDHEAAVINAREGMFDSQLLVSDCASLNGFINAILEKFSGIHFLRDITRGGLSGILHEISSTIDLGIEINETDIPVNDHVLAFCETLGFDPYQMACEGRCIIIADSAVASELTAFMKQHELGHRATQIGRITSSHPGDVVMETMIGSRRMLKPPLALKTPRIC
jgi:hydrogenase expression/formation protein HypE